MESDTLSSPESPSGIGTPDATSKKRRILIAIGIVCFLILIFLLLYFLRHTPSSVSETQEIPESFPVEPARTTVIAQSGRERIFQADLEYELSSYPAGTSLDEAAPDTGVSGGQTLESVLIEKIRKDSAILQQGEQEGIITLDESVFNSVAKDYPKRIDLVKQVEEALKAKRTHIEGTVLAIWFQNGEVEPLGLEQSKALAFTKLTFLQRAVKNRTMTVEQAIDAIVHDTELAQLDPVYQDNAAFTFSAEMDERITLDPEFDSILKALPEGEVSNVFLGKPNGVEALYLFGVITKKV